jgi:hypothetical protein
VPAIQSDAANSVPHDVAFLFAMSRSLKVELTEGAIRVRQGARVLTLLPAPPPPDAEDASDFILHLDDIATWDPPNEEMEIGIVDLQRILRAVEAECERHGLSVEFD